MKIQRIVCGMYAANAYVTDDGIVIDPGDDIAALRRVIPAPKAILLTHGHFDHMLGAEALQKDSGAKVYIHENDSEMLSNSAFSAYNPSVSVQPQPKDIVYTGYPEELFGFRVIHTPGHSRGSVCLYNEKEKILFSGDTLFRAGYGRYDLHGGSLQQLVKSLQLLLSLPEDVTVYPGHGEATTISEERRRYGR